MSLLEILLSLTIGTALLFGMVKILSITQAQWHIVRKTSLSEQHLQLAQFFLQSDIRQSGYLGCSNLDRIELHQPTKIIKAAAITGEYDSTLKTDVIHLRYAARQGSFLKQAMANPSSPLWLNTPLSIPKHYQWVISNCKQAEFFSIENQNTSPSHLIQHGELSRTYSIHAYVAPFIQHSYFVKATNRKNTSLETTYALFRKGSDGKVQELIEGIDKIKISYASHLSALKFVEAKQVIDWEAIRAVKIFLRGGAHHRTFYTHLRNTE